MGSGEPNLDEPVLSVENFRKTYGDGEVVAVDDVSFSVESGTVVGLLGPNGAGKTSTIKSALGIVIPDRGEIRLNGVDVHEDHRKAYENVSAVLEGARNVYWRLTVVENLSFFASLQGIDPREAREEHEQLLELLGIADKRDEVVRNLSRGMKQKTALACALARQTPVLFLDEPTLGLDVEASYDLRRELERLVEQENRTVILSSHDMDVVQDLCDRVIIMDDGEIVTDERVDDLVDLFRTQAYEVTVGDRVSGRLRSELEREFDAGSWDERADRTVFEVSLRDPDRFYDLTDALRDAGATLLSVSAVEPDLESVFLEVTNRVDEEAVPGTDDETTPPVEGRP
ncbi:ABC transporter ATP-binding protein [Halorussus salilacus]|uniref:ABC transporter ATP-binding protein n=1 Tax=Halorussus salilacus TaxID=2953750 RepID=UPI00209D1BC1|nr:ABC transporter ATP-binding protein [Halorussus salilacus]USZ68751.1 ABC transporter ATP-binding protein [Halorussus salilacus]